MEYAEWLEPLALQFLDNWRNLNDSGEIKDLVLASLRSLNSRHRAHKITDTECQSQFNSKKMDPSLSKPLKFSQLGMQE
jgi:hypothetical protein